MDDQLSPEGAPGPAPMGAETAGAEGDRTAAHDGTVSAGRDPDDAGTAPGPGEGRAPEGGAGGATASQLRRFIKSRPWVPMHELRRRFAIEGSEDEMSPVDLRDGRIFVGLPPREAALLGDLIRQGEIGFELVHDPDCPAIAGVYPMRPVVRT